MCNALKQRQEAERMVVSCKTLGTKMSQRNRQDVDNTSIKICHMPPSSVEYIQRMRSQSSMLIIAGGMLTCTAGNDVCHRQV